MSEQQDPLIGALVGGRYKVIKRLGEGGMGQVYLAEHEIIQKKVALKILRPEYSEKADIVTRFQQEAISASRIKHPNVLEVFDFGQLETGSFYLAMEFLEGRDLSDEIASRGSLEPARGLPIAFQICRALAAAHEKGVVHRDMKPENVFLQRTADGEEIVKIVDFGIAQLRTTEEAAAQQPTRRRLTKTGMIFGTPEYMSPEQAMGKHADHRVDVYAVGIILYEMFTGAVPFTGETFMAVLASHLNDEPPAMREVAPDLALSHELEAVISHALAKKPEDRFQSMAELSQALLATPEGAYAGRFTLTVEQRGEGAPSVGAASAPTAAQFAGNSSQRTAAQFAAGVADPVAAAIERERGTAAAGSPAMPGTLLEMEAQLPAAPRRNLSYLVAGGLAALVAGSAAVFFLARSGSTEPGPATASIDAAGAAGGAASAEVITAPVAPTPLPPSPSGLRIHVVTVPAGATVAKDGFEACPATPCDILAGLNETMELTATLGDKTASKKLLVQRDQTVTLELAAPPKTRPKPDKPKPPTPPPPTPSGPRMCEIEQDGLKFLRPCPQ